MKRTDIEDILQLTPLQSGLLYHEVADPGSGAYCVQVYCEVNGDLDVGCLRSAWQQVVARHPALRTQFRWAGREKPVQIVRKVVDPEWTLLDWSDQQPATQSLSFEQRLAEDRRRGFDLAESPPLRLALVRLGPGRHRLLWSYHHILLDGWSMQHVLGEVRAIHDALVAGREPRLDPSPPFREHVQWLQGRAPDESADYWRELLTGTTPVRLDVDRGGADGGFGELATELDAGLSARLTASARQHDLTLNTLLQGAWALLLSRHGGGRDVVFGATQSGRSPEIPGVESIVGLFINTLPVRLQVDTRLSPRDWLQDIQTRQLEQLSHSHSALSDIRSWCGVRGREALFESVLVLENYPRRIRGSSIRFDDLQSREQTPYPLALMVVPGERIGLRAIHERARFDDETVVELVAYFEAALRWLSSDAPAWSDAPAASPADVERVTAHGSGPVVEPDEDASFQALFEEQVAARPDATAVSAADGCHSYAELNRRANRLAHLLRDEGVGPEVRVGISLERSRDLIVAILAVLKAGGAYVPLDPSYPRERLAFMVEDADTSWVLTTEALRDRLPTGVRRPLLVDRLDDRLQRLPATNPPSRTTADHLAYMIHTSGSTGRPKAVLIQHGSLCNLTAAQLVDLPREAGGRHLQFASASFDASVFELVMALRSGATLCLAPADEVLIGRSLGDFLLEQQITRVTLPPSILATVPAVQLRALDCVIVAGEACPLDLILRWSNGRRFFNAYGPTETTVWATVQACGPDDTSVAIGAPIAGASALVLDEDLRPLPVGVTGTLYVGGLGLARGYHGRRQETAAAFVPDPFGPRPGGRLYCTGDRVRLTRDGRLEFRGRQDQQVKLRGFRIELGEIESALRRSELVDQAAVLLVDDGRAEPRLVAHLVGAVGAEADDAVIREHLRRQLPAHSLPSAFLWHAALPLTASGKIDRHALPAPHGARPDLSTGYVAPRGETEELLANIWANVLALSRVGARDDFFEIGGNSLLAMRLAARIQSSLGIDLSVREIFGAPSIARLAGLLEDRRATRKARAPLEAGEHGAQAPLSFAQQRLWFLDRWDRQNPTYNMPVAHRLSGLPDFDLLRQALDVVVARHESLRTAFSEVGGVAVQVLRAPEAVELVVEDLRHVPSGERLDECRQRMSREARTPLQLDRGRLLRARAYRLDDDAACVLITLHHIAADGWSVGVLLRELSQVYRALQEGRRPELPPPAVQSADHAAWERGLASQGAFADDVGHWVQQLQGAPRLDIPADRPRPAQRRSRGGVLTRRLPAALSGVVRRTCRREEVTEFMLLLGAFGALLQRCCQADDLVIGTPVANRNHPAVDGLVGLLVNTLPLRLDLGGDPTFQDVLQRVRGVCLQAHDHAEVPFEMLVDELESERDLSRTPLFQVMFVLQDEALDALDLAGVQASPLTLDTGTAKFDLTLGVRPTPTGYELSWEYDAALFDAASVAGWHDTFATLLEGLLADPLRRVSDVPLATPEQGAAALTALNPARRSAGSDTCLHTLFERQVRRSPDAIALTWGAESHGYDALNRRANRLAHHLRRLGVGPEVKVAVCVDRSVGIVVSILGVLKTGGAYVPLDPAYPDERLEFMLADSGSRLVVTGTRHVERMRSLGLETLDVEDTTTGLADEPEHDPPCLALPDNGAYLIYTSGSTGRPKGVVITHRNVVRLFEVTRDRFRFDATDVWSLFHSYAFDFSVWEIWGALLHGGRLVVVPHDVTRDPERFHALVARERISVLNQTPSAFQQLIRVDERSERRLDSLRFVVFGGEALEFRRLKPWFDRHGDRRPRLVNMYGITETTVHVTHRELGKRDAGRATAGSIGHPLEDLSGVIVDPRGRLQPLGVPGELMIAGGGLARGYHERPDLTAARFVPDAFGDTPGARRYRTGDLVRARADGSLDYRGRIDHQVQIRGFRIELGEVATTIEEHPDVEQAVVVARTDAHGDRRLVAYFVSVQGRTVPLEALRGFLKDRLPEHMIPAVSVALEALPLTPTGKTDLDALPAPGGLRPELTEEYVEPRDDTERKLADVWGDVLDVDRVGAHDNFFSLGGDSILSIQVLDGARRAGLPMSLQQLFRSPTIAQLAEELGRAAPEASDPAGRPATSPFSLIAEEDRRALPADVVDAYPLARLQLGMIYHMVSFPESNVYHCTGSCHLRTAEPLQVGAFEEAVRSLVERHDVYRTSFDLDTYSQPLQLVHADAVLPLEVHDVRGLPAAEQERVLDDLMVREAQTPFDLSRPTLLRFFIHIRSDRTFQFTITECHPIIDGWSYHSTIVEVFRRYLFLTRGVGEAVEPALRLAYRDFIALEQEALGSAETRHFWSRSLAGAADLRLPRWTSYPRRSDGRPDLQKLVVDVPLATSRRLLKLANSLRVPIKSVLLAAHLKVLGLLTGRDDLVSGVAVNGRPEDIEGERLRGLFLNTVPFRQTLGDGSWETLIRAVFRNDCEILPHRRYPLGEILDCWGSENRCDEVLFNYLNFHVYDELPESLQLEVIDTLNLDGTNWEGTNFNLVVHFQFKGLVTLLDEDALMLALDYDANEFSHEQMQLMARTFSLVLDAMVDDPEGPHRASMVSLEDREQLLGEWNATRTAHPSATGIHRLVEAQVDRTPDAVAVSFEGEQWTYRELDRAADRLARRLAGHGVRAEVPVAICLERSLELVVALLAVLKAGGAYVPLDPESPAARRALAIEDSHAALVLTTTDWADSLPSGVLSLCLDVAEQQDAGLPVRRPAGPFSPDQLAYIIYTSGSTGKPKGVMNHHRGVCNRLLWMQDRFRLGAGDRVLQKTPCFFDVSVWEFFWPLMTGATLVLARPGGHRDPAYLDELIGAQRVSATHFVPTMLQAFLDSEPRQANSALALVICSGEALPPGLVGRFQERFDAELHNLYGPTEASIEVTAWACPPDEVPDTVPIGRPISNIRTYVLDRSLDLAPVGVGGELFLSGVGVARGYARRPGLTAAAFLPDPFADEPGQRMYRTGDWVRHRAGGELEFLGRMDSQIKLNGYRIELEEIESVLEETAGIRAAFVLLDGDTPETRHLVAHIVAPELGSTMGLRRQLRSRLPDSMVPSRFVQVQSLPMTPSGKVDRAAVLRRDDGDGQAAAPSAHGDMQSETERSVAAVWMEVLEIDGVEREDNFFDLGGTSFQAIVAVNKIASVTGRRLNPRSLFLNTLTQVAEDCEAAPMVDGPQT